jgi:hypothetical protein
MSASISIIRPGRPDDRQDVESQVAPRDPVLRQPDVGQLSDASGLGVVDCFHGQAEALTGAGLDLAHHQAGTVGQDEVEFAVAAAPVAVQHDETGMLQVSDGQVFATPAEGVRAVGCAGG